MQQKQVQLSADWIPIVILMFVCWPIGLLLLFRKLSRDRSAAFSVKGGKMVSVVGWALAMFGGIGVIATISQGSEVGAVVVSAVFLLGGLAVIWKSKVMAKKAKKYRMYISIVVNEGETRIDKIADSAGINKREVADDLQDMLDKGYFKGHINHKEQELVLARADVENAGDMHMDIVRCTSCGADNKVVSGRVRKCEFCRSLVGTERH